MTTSHRLWSEARAGLRDIAPAAVAAIPIGLLFGAVAVGKGMSPTEIGLMSLLVFAGGAQFAAIETWIQPAPVLTLAFATFLINARHVSDGRFPVFKAGTLAITEIRRPLLPHG